MSGRSEVGTGGRRALEPVITDISTPPLAEPAAGDPRATFRARYPDRRFAPVVVVIPAFNEEESIGPVLDGIPREACGLAVDTLVIDDGSSDATAEVSAAHGVFVARLPENSGQGSALRFGYELAREHDARF